MQEQEEKIYKAKLTSTRLHFFYIVVILIGSLILMATRDWTKLEGFTDYLSVSATITSLVLGVLAIIYGFVSSNSTNSFLGSVESSAREMNNVGSQLRELLSKAQELQGKSEARNEELHALIGNLRSTIDNLTASTTNIAGTVESLPVKIDSLRTELLEKATNQTMPAAESVVEADLPADQIRRFVSVSSILGLAALKALVEASIRTRPADLRRIFKGEYVDPTEYAHGYLVASSCAGIVDFDVENKNKQISKIVFSNGSLDIIQDEWENRKNHGSESTINSIKNYTARIDASFAPLPAPDVGQPAIQHGQ